MKLQHTGNLDAQINDYMLSASGHRKNPKSLIDAHQLAAFSAATGSALVMVSQAEAAIVQTTPGAAPGVSPSPAWVVSATGIYDTAPIDLDNDGNIDLRIGGYGGAVLYNYSYNSNFYSTFAWYAGAGLKGEGANRVIGAPNGSFADASKLSSGASIGPAGPWTNTYASVFYTTYFNGQNRQGADGWSGGASETGFVGVQFNISGNTHYGWVRLQFGPAVGEFSAVEWAYEACPDTPIQAGATSGGPAQCPSSGPGPGSGSPAPIPVMGPAAYGLAILALGGLGLANLRRRRLEREAAAARR